MGSRCSRLAEAYGPSNERDLWPGGKGSRSIGEALELAVRARSLRRRRTRTGHGGTRPTHRRDTSVSGEVLVGLLAAPNAGIEVPDKTIDKAIAFYVS